MTNPYKVLGVSETADMDEIKKQYRALSRKYHPDANINNPNKDQAEEKFKEVQAAYEQIVDEREHGKTGNYGSSNGSSYGGYGDFGGFGGFGDFGGFYRNAGNAYEDKGTDYERAAENYIRTGRYKEALNTLSNTPSEDRSARWYYISAMANYNLGYTVTAIEHAKTACSMEPSNTEYQRMLNVMQSGGRWYTNTSGGFEQINSSGCLKSCLYCLAINLCCGGGGRLCLCI